MAMSKQLTGTMRRARGVWPALVLVVAAGCKPRAQPEGAPSGCVKDTDCKGDRVCEAGRCVAPPTPEDGEAAPPVRVEEAASPAFWRGGPGGVALPVEGPTRKPDIAWELDLGAVVFARPVLVEADSQTVAYVGNHAGRFVGVGIDGAQDGELLLDMTLGGMVWATAAADGEGRLYVGADNDTLYAIDPAARKIIWERQLGSCKATRAPGPEGARCDADGGPTVGPDGDLYLGADGLYRLTRDGEEVWHYPDGEDEPGHVFSTPAVAPDGKVYFGGQDGFVTALSGEGEKLWQYKITADVDGSAALARDGTVYVGADDGRLHALRPDGSLRWSFVSQKDVRSSVAVGHDGAVYMTSFDGSLYALEPGGDVRWVLPTAGRIMSSPVVDAAGNVYFGSQDDHLYGVSPEGKVLWSVQFPGDVDSSVSISSKGTLVVGCDDGKLRALRVPAG
jgi:outer membrane protein assembly factor BamB